MGGQRLSRQAENVLETCFAQGVKQYPAAATDVASIATWLHLTPKIVEDLVQELQDAGFMQGPLSQPYITERGMWRAKQLLLARFHNPLPSLNPCGPPDFPWAIPNPTERRWETANGFTKNFGHAKGNLQQQLIKKMAAILVNPEKGQATRGILHGGRKAYLANNYRIRWRELDDGGVRFTEFCSKEDPEY